MSEVLLFPRLQQITGYTRLSDVERCLREQGVPFMRCRNGLVSTMTALNSALGVSPTKADANYVPSDLF